MLSINEYAVLGNRKFFLNRPHSIGGRKGD